MSVSFQQNVSPIEDRLLILLFTTESSAPNTEPFNKYTFNKRLLKELNEKHSTLLCIILYFSNYPSFSQDYNLLEMRNYILIILRFPHST